MDDYQRVFESNRRWVAERNAEDPEFFERLAAEQNPQFLFIGCSDSRVPANQIMGVQPGEVFVHRNVANLVVNTDINGQSVIAYAVDILHVKHIVVCGHYGCGGIHAAMQQQDFGILNGWLREVRDVYRLHEDELDAIEDGDARHRRLVELNIMEQCYNVIKTASVLRHFGACGYPRVHGWAYDLRNGLLNDLEVPFDDLLTHVEKLYKLV